MWISSRGQGAAQNARKIAKGCVRLLITTRRLMLGSPRARPQPNPSPQSRGWVPDSRGSLFATLMVWVSIVYLVVPNGYLTGDMVGENETGMAEPNPVLR